MATTAPQTAFGSRSQGTATSPARHRDDKIRICAQTVLRRPVRKSQVYVTIVRKNTYKGLDK